MSEESTAALRAERDQLAHTMARDYGAKIGQGATFYFSLPKRLAASNS